MGCFPFGREPHNEGTDYGKRGRSKRWKKNKKSSHYNYEMEGESYGHPTSRSMIYYNEGPIVTVQPEPVLQYHHQETRLVGHDHVVAAAVGSGGARPPPRVRFALPGEGQQEVVQAAVAHEGKVGPLEFSSGHPHQGNDHMCAMMPPTQGYAPSPLIVPSEYSYPSPAHEGVYRLGTDANRFTTMFSEENPNACSIT